MNGKVCLGGAKVVLTWFNAVFLHRQERRAYYLHRYRARKYPERYMTSIADGRDQHTTNVTKLRRISKTMSALSPVGTHLVGCIVHSGQSPHGEEVYGSLDYYQFPHDANLTMTTSGCAGILDK